MKTFSEFILEAENASSQIAALRARANQARQRGDMETFIKLQKQAAEIGAGTQAKIASVSSDKPKPTTNPNSYVGGRASKPADTRGSSGSLPNVASPAGEGSGSRVAGRYGDLRKGSSNNIGSTQINTGRGYTGRKFGKGGNR